MNFNALSDFVTYLGAYFSGGSEYRQEWRIWHYDDNISITSEELGVEPIDSDDCLNSLEENIEKENAEIKDKLDRTLMAGAAYEEAVQSSNLLDGINNGDTVEKTNRNDYETLLENLSSLIRELDSYQQRLETDEAKNIIDIASLHLIEAMEDGTIDVINNDKEFNILYHTAIPSQNVLNGTPIKETMRPGLKIGNRVLVRAQVRV